MASVATTTPDDVRRYVDTDLSDADVQAYIDDAEAEALTFNDESDFAAGQLDRLVMFYAAYLIGSPGGTESTRLKEGSKSVTIKSADGLSFLSLRVQKTDPSGLLLGPTVQNPTVTSTSDDT